MSRRIICHLQFFRAFLLLGFITACTPVSTYTVKTTSESHNLFNDALMGEPVSVPELKQLFVLSDNQKTEFLTALHHPDSREELVIESIYRYLKTRLDNFNFHADTLTAEQTLAQNAGNCLSLAILTKALTDISPAGIYFELARTPSVYQRENGYSLSSQHIQTVIYEKSPHRFYSSKPQRITIDYYSTLGSRTLRRVSSKEFYAMFYSNRAAEALIHGENQIAYWYLKEAIRIDDENLIAINLLAVLYQNLNLEEYAERAFIYGLSFAKDQMELLSNYHRFLVSQGRDDEAQVVLTVLDDYDDPDPFKWIDLADQKLIEKNYRAAIKYYQKANERASYLHQPYAGMAKAYFYLGQNIKAENAIKHAIEQSYDVQFTSAYKAKYNYFKSKHRQ